MRGTKNMFDIKAQLLIAAILVSATGTVSAETAADQTTPPAVAAATETAVPKADAVKKPEVKKAHTASLLQWCSCGRVGLVLGTAY